MVLTRIQKWFDWAINLEDYGFIKTDCAFILIVGLYYEHEKEGKVNPALSKISNDQGDIYSGKVNYMRTCILPFYDL